MMNKKIAVFIFTLIIGLSFNFAWAQEVATDTAELGPQTGDEVAEPPFYELEVPIGSVDEINGVGEYIKTIYTFGVSIVGVLATVMIMFGGWQWIFAAGNEKAITSAKEYITSAIIGLVLALSSYLILFTINPGLVEFTELSVWKIVPNASPAAELNCSWKDPVEAVGTSLISSNDDFCAAVKSEDSYKCYCDLRSNIVNKAKLHAAADDLYHDCCWGWTNAVWNEAGAKFFGSRVYKSSIYTTTTGDLNGDGAGCVPGDNSYNNTSICTDFRAPYSEIQPGDWLYFFNGNSAGLGQGGNGMHSAILIRWVDESNHVGWCASAPGVGYEAKEHECDFIKWPIMDIFTPAPSSTYNPDAGKCGGY